MNDKSQRKNGRGVSAAGGIGVLLEPSRGTGCGEKLNSNTKSSHKKGGRKAKGGCSGFRVTTVTMGEGV